MKRLIFFTIALLPVSLIAQQSENPKVKKWNHELFTDFTFFKDDFIFVPDYRVNNGNLHLQARYNYEDLETGSVWIGYNLEAGNELSFEFTPMIGGVAGEVNGVAPGFIMTLGYKNFELYSESEYFFDFNEKENNFLYNCSDLTYTIKDVFWTGFSIQRTRIIDDGLEVQVGLVAAATVTKWFDIYGYVYNIKNEDRYYVISMAFNF